MLRPVEHTRVSQEAVDQIVNLIRSRQLGPGDRLPGERQLVQALGISRTSVREALRSLEGMGLIEVRAGVGTFVKHPVSEFVEAALPPQLLVDRETLNKLFELREIIETGAVAIAARKATRDDLDNIRQALERMEAYYVDQDLDGMVNADIELHRAILVATGNDILVRVVDNVADLLKEMRRASLSISEGVPLTIAGHRAILEALERRQPEDARQAMQEHLTTVFRKVDAVKITEAGDMVYKDGRGETSEGFRK
ncbi:MAG: FadR/GntR family transcriptional regulator [Anaerolineae bacterium]